MSAVPATIIVGAGQAGARCAALLRDQGYTGSITLIGDEPHLPYERPPLSKQALLAEGADLASHVPPMFPAAYFSDNRIELRTSTTVENLDIAGKLVRLADGDKLPYTTLVLATGSRPRPYHRQDAPCELLTLRDLQDASRLRSQLLPGKRLLLIGGGFIGLEIAAAATTKGCAVMVVESQNRILQRSLSVAAAARVHELHENRGVTIKTGARLEALSAGAGGTDFLLSDGTRGQADIVVLGIGGLPNAELAVAAGIEPCSNTGGIPVDERCRTSAPNVYAIGDVASELNTHYGIPMRLESWDNAENQAVRAAADIIGLDDPSNRALPAPNYVPWFWTDQYDLNLQIIGITHGADRFVERRGTAGKRIFFHFRGPRLLGAELFDCGRERRLVRQLVATEAHIDEAALENDAVPLKQVLAMTQDARERQQPA